MMARCLHGFFIFQETKFGQVSDFMSYTGLSIAPRGDYFTFETLVEAPKYSIKGKPYLGLPATINFEGEPWEVMKANGFVYDFSTDLLKPIEAETQVVKIQLAGKYFVSNGLILPGSVTDDGDRVKDYAAHFSHDSLKWRYSEVTYV